MPPLTPEEKKARDAQVELLTTAFRAHLAFPYQQNALLKEVRALKGSEGVCYGICADWLARHLWNLYRPLATKGKPALDSAKFTGNVQKKLTTKHGELQAMYAENRFGDNIFRTLAERSLRSSHPNEMAERNKLLARLRSQVLGRATIAATAPEAVRVNSFTGALDREWTKSAVPLSAPPNYADGFRIAFRKAARKVDFANQGVGLMIGFGDGAGHETVALFTAGQGRFLDPNVGEYFFDLPSQFELMVTFASSLWWTIYVRFYDFTSVRFERITCVDEDEAPPVIEL